MPSRRAYKKFDQFGQLLRFLNRTSNFDTEEYSKAMNVARTTAQPHLRCLEYEGFIELVTYGAGAPGGSVWRSLLRVNYKGR